MVQLQFVSSMEKVLSDRPWKPEITDYRTDKAVKGEVFAFQIACSGEGTPEERAQWFFKTDIPDEFAGSVSFRKVIDVPVRLTALDELDDNVLSRYPALLPDLLQVWNQEEAINIAYRGYFTLWVSVQVPERIAAGKYDFKFSLCQKSTDGNQQETPVKIFTLEVLNTELPPQKIKRTEWFYADCICNYYNIEAWSDGHWSLLEKYFRNQTAHGCTRILTPLFTPPLDTEVGGERLTVQLVKVSRKGEGGYAFDLSLLERWIELAFMCGYQEIEFAHLFTQWGAEFTPKIIVDGEKLFGWHVRADSKEYSEFLKAFIPVLTAFLEEKGWQDKVVFHISDEPQEKHLPDYTYASELIRSLLGDKYTCTDALSNLEFVRQGVCQLPVPSVGELPVFKEAEVSPLWAYYCCGPEKDTTNRFIHFPAARTRALGLLLFAYDCAGFLHWGYNFWYSRLSKKVIDPYVTTDADGNFPAGDPFLVYPGSDGPVDSIRNEILREAFQDHRACKMLEAAVGREKALEIVTAACGGRITVTEFPQTARELSAVREKIYQAIAEKFPC